MTTREMLAGLVLAVGLSAVVDGPVLAQGVAAQPTASGEATAQPVRPQSVTPQRVAAGNATLQVGDLLQLRVLPADPGVGTGDDGQVSTRVRLEVVANRPWRISGPPLEGDHSGSHVVLAQGGAGRTTVVLDYGSAPVRGRSGAGDLGFTLSPE
ncbi:MAG TPA: hypothetical protein VK966_04810 [Longimicrobiales bacterium]|nr:hypothetical protein [Longimicrobiales bacterium]